MSNAKRDAIWALYALGFLLALLFCWASIASQDWLWLAVALVAAVGLGWLTFKRKRPCD